MSMVSRTRGRAATRARSRPFARRANPFARRPGCVPGRARPRGAALGLAFSSAAGTGGEGPEVARGEEGERRELAARYHHSPARRAAMKHRRARRCARRSASGWEASRGRRRRAARGAACAPTRRVRRRETRPPKRERERREAAPSPPRRGRRACAACTAAAPLSTRPPAAAGARRRRRPLSVDDGARHRADERGDVARAREPIGSSEIASERTVEAAISGWRADERAREVARLRVVVVGRVDRLEEGDQAAVRAAEKRNRRRKTRTSRKEKAGTRATRRSRPATSATCATRRVHGTSAELCGDRHRAGGREPGRVPRGAIAARWARRPRSARPPGFLRIFLFHACSESLCEYGPAMALALLPLLAPQTRPPLQRARERAARAAPVTHAPASTTHFFANPRPLW